MKKKKYIAEERELGPFQYRRTVCLEFFLMRAIVRPQSAARVDESGPEISSRGPLGPYAPSANGPPRSVTKGSVVCLIMSHKWEFHVNSRVFLPLIFIPHSEPQWTGGE